MNRTDSCSRKKEAEPDPRRRHASSIRFPLRALPCSPLGEPLGPRSFLLLLQLGRGLRLSLFRCGHTGPPGCRTPHAPCTRRFLYRAFNLRLLSEGSPAMPFRGEEAPNLRRTRSKRIEILEKKKHDKKRKRTTNVLRAIRCCHRCLQLQAAKEHKTFPFLRRDETEIEFLNYSYYRKKMFQRMHRHCAGTTYTVLSQRCREPILASNGDSKFRREMANYRTKYDLVCLVHSACLEVVCSYIH